MIDWLVGTFVLLLLRLRYRIRARGFRDVAQRGRSGILFLPNHPAIIDPLIVVARLFKRFRPRPLADADQMDRPIVRWFADHVGVLRISDMSKHGPEARDAVAGVVDRCAEALRNNENILLYPSGHLYRSKLEDLRGNTAVKRILEQAPGCRVVLIRTRGLWGSSFSFATGEYPNLLGGIKRHIRTLLKNLLFFAPRRDVSIEMWEPENLPRHADVKTLNAFLETYYNEDAPPARYVPYTHWEHGGRRDLPEPKISGVGGAPEDVPESTRRIVLEYLATLLKVDRPQIENGRATNPELQFDQRLGEDLGMDSLARAELLVWLGNEFGFHTADVASLKTVGDVILAARGQSSGARPVDLAAVPAQWFANEQAASEVIIPDGATIPAVFLRQALRRPKNALLADQLAGVRTYRDVLTAIFALRPMIAAYPGDCVGIMLPASVGATITYLATLFAGKTPVLVNWTTGARNIAHALELTGVQKVMTAGALVRRIESQGTDLSAIREKLVLLEEERKKLGLMQKIGAALQARFFPGRLRTARVTDTAAILLTSGSEALPKAVPLSHLNILTNLRDVLKIVTLRDCDRLLGFLPPFHSFGISITSVLPLVSGIRVAYHANPTEGWVLAKMIEAYRATVMVGTPTFLSSILRSSQDGQLDTLRLVVTGAEKCPQATYELIERRCPDCLVLEGYGVTECSPIIAANTEADPQPGTIGRLLPSYEAAIIDIERQQPVAENETGMLLVRGPSVFAGYLGDAPSPFVQYDGKQWYKTGDLVTRDSEGVLTFRGRLKRFIKLGGEMISLPAIESVLLAAVTENGDDGPLLAVEATPSEEHPEIVLFTVAPMDRQEANQLIRAAHLSALHNISRVERIDEIPTLGTGKTDYKALKQRLEISSVNQT
ncbi:MAG: AMP-binding protein [Phycisphaerae bacterium]